MEIPTKNKLDFSIWLTKCLKEVSLYRPREVVGFLPKEISFDAVEHTLDRFNLTCDLINSKTRKIHFQLPHGNQSFFAWSLEQLLADPRKSKVAPDRFYIKELDYLHPDQEDIIPSKVRGYLQRLELIKAIQPPFSDYDHDLAGRQTLVFIADSKLEIEITLDHGDLEPVDSIDELISEFIFPSKHEIKKRDITKLCLIELLSETASRTNKTKISALIGKADELLERAKHHYDLFMSEFSFEKIKGEIEKEKLEFTIKLNTVFSSIQNQLLAIPVALVLVGGQMQSTDTWSQRNIVIWLGALVFAILLSLLVRNQKNTLSAINQEIQQQWSTIQNEHKSVADRFTNMYDALDKRYRNHVLLIYTVDFLVAGSLALATGFLLWVSVPRELMWESLRISLWGIPGYLLLLYLWHLLTPAAEALARKLRDVWINKIKKWLLL